MSEEAQEEISHEQIHYDNREIVFAFLLKIGAFRAVIDFDGSGDSGSINDITCEGINEDLQKVASDVILKRVREDWKNQRWVRVVESMEAMHDKTLYGMLHNFADQLLENSGYDWYNNDGGFGTITIVPGEKKIEMDMNVRITSSEQHLIDM